jgi:hypothetical protein
MLDIITDYGRGVEFEPHPYGHALHIVAAQVLADPGARVTFVLTADAICEPCRHLRPDGQCGDVLHQLEKPLSKQAYNDELDRRLFSALGMCPGEEMALRTFLERVQEHTPGIETICTHPGEQETSRREGLEQGLTRLGLRK